MVTDNILVGDTVEFEGAGLYLSGKLAGFIRMFDESGQQNGPLRAIVQIDGELTVMNPNILKRAQGQRKEVFYA